MAENDITNLPTSVPAGGAEFPKSAPADRGQAGPLDDSEAGAVKPAVDLGSLRIEPKRGMQLRLEVEKNSQRVIAVTLEFDGSSLQLQPFAAPRSSGLWHAIRGQIMEQIVKQGGQAKEQEGPFGPEVQAVVPVQTGGSFGTRNVRFVGVDGPRWFLRGVISGAAATNSEAAEVIHAMFRNVVVVRGSTPMPPRDLLPLSVPVNPEEPQEATSP
jgi:hypothetical protein